MPCPRLVLLLSCLLLPLHGMAQVPPPPLVPAPAEPQEKADTPDSEEDPYGGYEDEDPPPEEDAAPGEIIPREWSPSERLGRKIPRIPLAFLGGAGLGFLLSTPGLFLALEAAFCEGCDDGFSLFLLGVSLASTGMSIGTALGVRGVGGLLWGEGRFLPTLVGTTVGTLAGLAVGIVLSAIGRGGGEIGVIPVFTFPAIGGIIAYEMTHAAVLDQRTREAGAETSVAPMVGVSPRGGIIGGLAGAF